MLTDLNGLQYGYIYIIYIFTLQTVFDSSFLIHGSIRAHVLSPLKLGIYHACSPENMGSVLKDFGWDFFTGCFQSPLNWSYSILDFESSCKLCYPLIGKRQCVDYPENVSHCILPLAVSSSGARCHILTS